MRGEIEQFLTFLLVDLTDPGMGMTNIHTGDATDEINVLSSLLIVEKFFVALDRKKWLFVVVCVNRRDVILEAPNFLVGLACVRMWLVSGKRCGLDDQIGNLH